MVVVEATLHQQMMLITVLPRLLLIAQVTVRVQMTAQVTLLVVMRDMMQLMELPMTTITMILLLDQQREMIFLHRAVRRREATPDYLISTAHAQ